MSTNNSLNLLIWGKNTGRGGRVWRMQNWTGSGGKNFAEPLLFDTIKKTCSSPEVDQDILSNVNWSIDQPPQPNLAKRNSVTSLSNQIEMSLNDFDQMLDLFDNEYDDPKLFPGDNNEYLPSGNSDATRALRRALSRSARHNGAVRRQSSRLPRTYANVEGNRESQTDIYDMIDDKTGRESGYTTTDQESSASDVSNSITSASSGISENYKSVYDESSSPGITPIAGNIGYNDHLPPPPPEFRQTERRDSYSRDDVLYGTNIPCPLFPQSPSLEDGSKSPVRLSDENAYGNRGLVIIEPQETPSGFDYVAIMRKKKPKAVNDSEGLGLTPDEMMKLNQLLSDNDSVQFSVNDLTNNLINSEANYEVDTLKNTDKDQNTGFDSGLIPSTTDALLYSDEDLDQENHYETTDESTSYANYNEWTQCEDDDDGDTLIGLNIPPPPDFTPPPPPDFIPPPPPNFLALSDPESDVEDFYETVENDQNYIEAESADHFSIDFRDDDNCQNEEEHCSQADDDEFEDSYDHLIPDAPPLPLYNDANDVGDDENNCFFPSAPPPPPLPPPGWSSHKHESSIPGFPGLEEALKKVKLMPKTSFDSQKNESSDGVGAIAEMIARGAFKLKPTPSGAAIRTSGDHKKHVKNSPEHDVQEEASSTIDWDCTYLNTGEVSSLLSKPSFSNEGNISNDVPKSAVPTRKIIPVAGKLPRIASSHDNNNIDVTKLPGYQEVPESVAPWKKALIEKKNKQLLEKHLENLDAKKTEESKWKDIPEWKKNLLVEKEKKKIVNPVSNMFKIKPTQGDIPPPVLQKSPAVAQWKQQLTQDS